MSDAAKRRLGIAQKRVDYPKSVASANVRNACSTVTPFCRSAWIRASASSSRNTSPDEQQPFDAVRAKPLGKFQAERSHTARDHPTPARREFAAGAVAQGYLPTWLGPFIKRKAAGASSKRNTCR